MRVFFFSCSKKKIVHFMVSSAVNETNERTKKVSGCWRNIVFNKNVSLWTFYANLMFEFHFSTRSFFFCAISLSVPSLQPFHFTQIVIGERASGKKLFLYLVKIWTVFLFFSFISGARHFSLHCRGIHLNAVFEGFSVDWFITLKVKNISYAA